MSSLALASRVTGWLLTTQARLGMTSEARAALTALDDEWAMSGEIGNARAVICLADGDPDGALAALWDVLDGTALSPELLEALPRHETAHAALLADIFDVMRGASLMPEDLSVPPQAGQLSRASSGYCDIGAWTPRELRHSFVSIPSAHDVRLEDITDLVGHSSTSVTETVYRHEIRPALTDNATAVNRTLKANATELACPCSGKAIGSPIGSRNLNPKNCLTSRDGGI